MRSTLFSKLRLKPKMEYSLLEMNESIEANIYNIIHHRSSSKTSFQSISDLQEYYKKKF